MDWTIAPTEEEFFAKLKTIITDKTCLSCIGTAFKLAESAHRGQTRIGGEPYLNHCIAVAWYFITQTEIHDQLRLTTLVSVALLHDLIEDTIFAKESFLEFQFSHFSPDISNASFALTKAANGDRFIRTLASKDPVVLLVKGVDRLHNLKTILVCPTEKITRKLKETKDVILPWLKSTGKLDMKYRSLQILTEIQKIVHLIEREMIIIPIELTKKAD